METITCEHTETVEEVPGTKLQVAVCSLCGQTRKITISGEGTRSEVISKIGRIDGRIVMPPVGHSLDLSPEESRLVRAGWDSLREPVADRRTSQSGSPKRAPVKLSPESRELCESHKEEMIADYDNMTYAEFLRKWGISAQVWVVLRDEWHIPLRKKKEPEQEDVVREVVPEEAKAEVIPEPELKPTPEPIPAAETPPPKASKKSRPRKYEHKHEIVFDYGQISIRELCKKWGMARGTFYYLKRTWEADGVLFPDAYTEEPEPIAETPPVTEPIGRPSKYDKDVEAILSDYERMSISDLEKKWDMKRGYFKRLKKRWETEGVAVPVGYADPRAAIKGRPRKGKWLKCADCGKDIYVRKFRLDKDLEAEHRCGDCARNHYRPPVPKGKVEPEPELPKQEEPAKVYYCKKCDYSTTEKYQLIGHYNSKHSWWHRDKPELELPKPEPAVSDISKEPAIKLALRELAKTNTEDYYGLAMSALARCLVTAPAETTEVLVGPGIPVTTEKLMHEAFSLFIQTLFESMKEFEKVREGVYKLRDDT